MQTVGHPLREVKTCRYDDHAIKLAVKARHGFSKVVINIEAVKIVDAHRDIEIVTDLSGFLHPLLHFFPISYLVMTGNKHTEMIRFIIGQSRSIDIGLIVLLLKHLLYFFPRLS